MTLRLLLLMCLSCSGFANELRICADDRNVPPLLYSDGMGIAQYMVPLATEALGVTVRLYHRPQPRCLYGAANGQFDALLLASPNTKTEPFVVFPTNVKGMPDSRYAFVSMRVVAFRMKGANARWDGEHFLDLTLPVLYESGVPTVNMFMDKLPAPSRASARTPIHMMQMMRLGRADIAVGLEPAVRYAMQQNDPDQQFEVIEPPLFTSSLFLAFSKPFANANPALTRQLWEQIRLLSNGDEWQSIKAQVMNNQLPPTPQLERAVQLGLQPDARAP